MCNCTPRSIRKEKHLGVRISLRKLLEEQFHFVHGIECRLRRRSQSHHLQREPPPQRHEQPLTQRLFELQGNCALAETDLLARKDRFNVPGTAAKTNWSRRMVKTVKGLQESRSMRKRMRLIRELLEKTGRI